MTRFLLAPLRWLTRLLNRTVGYRRFRLRVWMVLVLLLLALIGVGYGMYATKQPLFCKSCHEMAAQYDTWELSTHHNVSCDECHVMPGLTGMVQSKLMGVKRVYAHVRKGTKVIPHGHVYDSNCRKCHPTTPEVVVYHGLKITHRKHWELTGSKCTLCHRDVVHGPEAAYMRKNTPRMAVCFTCHDGKRASNNCTLCHTTLGTRGAVTFSPEWTEGHKLEAKGHEQECKRCHGAEFCDACHRLASPHPADWLTRHPQNYRRNPKQCATCHVRAPGAKAEELAPFCEECHRVRRAHALNWISTHPDPARANPQECARCHEQSFCSDCHKIYEVHPDGWVATHPGPARDKPQSCKQCHTQSFCDRCHSNTVPSSHDRSWLQTHGQTAARQPVSCEVCHTTKFCVACHRRKPPSSHQRNWLQNHPGASAQNPALCTVCHAQSYCNNCHGPQFPHPAKWRDTHPTPARKDRAQCARCHTTRFCDDCHRGAAPTSHRNGWIGRHGKVAKPNVAYCAKCHDQQLCDACHHLPMPHPKGWLPDGHTKVVKEKPQVCYNCHSVPKFCKDCHGLDLPHPEDFVVNHKAVASLKPGSVCFRCHKTDFCKQCHPQ